MLAKNIQQFLLKQIEEKSLSRKELSQETAIDYPIIHDLLHAHKPQPALSTIIKISNAFKCSIAEVVGGRMPSSNIGYMEELTEKECMVNLKKYITHRIEENKLHPVTLAREIGSGSSSISDFIGKKPKKQSLRSAIILKLADHWEISIDEMIGRVDLSKEKTKLAKTKPDAVKQALGQKITTDNKKSKSFVEKINQERLNKDKTHKNKQHNR